MEHARLEEIIGRIVDSSGDPVAQMEHLQSLRDANAADTNAQKDTTDYKAQYEGLLEKYKNRFKEATEPEVKAPPQEKPKGINGLFKTVKG